MATYGGINGVKRKLNEWPIGIGGVVKQQKEVWATEGGVKRKIFSSGTSAGSLPVGSKLYIEESGVKATFIVVHQGKPSALYDESCNGAWILRERINTTKAISSSGYMSLGFSELMSYLNNDYVNSLPPDIRDSMRIAKIPYTLDLPNLSGFEVRSGSNGLACKSFVLCPYELGETGGDGLNVLQDGAKLDYFLSGTGTAANNKRKAKYKDLNIWAEYWTRSADVSPGSRQYCCILDYGVGYPYNVYNTYGVRPAFILPSSFPVDNYLA